MFIMIARVDRMATSAISENKELNFAVETVVAKISQELALDVPGMPKGPEYYDYPDANNAWLASLEPYDDGGTYKWRQISDVTGYLERKVFGRGDVDVELPSAQRPKPSEAWVRDYPQINVDENGDFLDKDGALAVEGLWADADGDGIADSKWVKLDDITSNKGKPIFAAIRIIDNGGMINVNTAYKFNPNVGPADVNLIDGSSQMQINLMAFSWGRDHTTYNASAETDLLEARANYGIGVIPADLDEYEKNVIWRYNEPNGFYTPFDISDELELRYRFLINHKDIDSRLEVLGLAQGWSWEFRTIYDFRSPAETGDLAEWFISSYDDGSLDPNYAYRHIATTYNMDRIIRPNGKKMLNINDANVNELYGATKSALDPNSPDVNGVAAQIAVNLIDFRDNDPNVVTSIIVDGTTYYGFERPCIYISEIAHRFLPDPSGGGPVGSDTLRSYAVELYKPYSEDAHPELNQWRLVIDGPYDSNININWTGAQQFHVIKWENTNTALDVDPGASSQPPIPNNYTQIFEGGSAISLRRCVDITNDIWISVDSLIVPDIDKVTGRWLYAEDGTPCSIQRDINPHKCIRRLWASPSGAGTPRLGLDNTYDGGGEKIQAHPENKPFTNIGEIGMVFRKSAYSIDTNDIEATARINLADPNFQQLFKYLSVFDPAVYPWNDPNGTRIKGRININTAPWFVLAQLPWVSQRISGTNYSLAQAIVAYRDKTSISGGPDYSGPTGRKTTTGINGLREEPGFESVGELNFIIGGSDNNYRIDYYDQHDSSNPANDLTGFPDLTPGDGAPDDFEERDVIFARISNLVTVRSDVFTAYILVRIGTDGPQKRVMAILDRSNVYLPTDKVRVVALHPVPDPR
jgi:hypothetical protein